MSSVDRNKTYIDTNSGEIQRRSLHVHLRGIIEGTDVLACRMDHTPGGVCEMRSPARPSGGGACGSCGLRLCLGSNVDSAVDIECLAGYVVAVLDQEAHSAGSYRRGRIAGHARLTEGKVFLSLE